MSFRSISAVGGILVPLLLTQGSYGAEQVDKYAHFELKPVYGVGVYALRTKPEPDSVQETYEKFFKTHKSFGVGPYLEYEPGKFAVIADVATRDKTLMNRFTACDFKGDGTGNYLTACGILAGVVDTNTGSVVRFNTPATLELDGASMIGTGSRDGFPIYGCYVENPFVAADLNLDGVPELFVIGGLGQYGDGGTTARTSIYIFDLKDDRPKQLFKTELSSENYQWDTEYTEGMDISPKYQSFSLSRFKSDGTTEASQSLKTLKLVPVQGIRIYTKLYFKDFNKNGKLDILVWRREYKSRLNTDPIKGYNLSKVIYQFYEESPAGFVEQPIQATLAEKYLKDNRFTWRKGFPWKNQCLGQKPDAPLIDRYQDPKQNIDDPVLDQ